MAAQGLVFSISALLQNLLKYQQGNKRKHWCDGNLAASLGHKSMIQIVCQPRLHFSINAMNEACRNGHIETVEFLHRHRKEGCSFRALDWAAKSGHLEVIEWLHQSRLEGCSTHALDGAAGNGHLLVVEWLVRHRQEGGTRFALTAAARNGHLEVMKWLDRQGVAGGADGLLSGPQLHSIINPDGPEYSLLCCAAQSGNLKAAEWVLGRVPEQERRGIEAVVSAAGHGHLSMVEWILSWCTSEPHFNATTEAAKGGHLQVLDYLHQEGFPVSPAASHGAASRGQLSVLEWMHTEGFPITPSALEVAVVHGDLALVEWLHRTQSTPLRKKLLWRAASAGHLSIVEWLHPHLIMNCGPRAMDKAAARGHLGVLEWLHRHRLGEGCTGLAMDQAAAGGHLATCEWLHAHYPSPPSGGCTHEALGMASERGHLKVAEWLYRNRAECRLGIPPLPHPVSVGPRRTSDLARAAMNGHLNVVEWHCRQGLDTDFTLKQSINLAALHGNLAVIEWLHNRRCQRIKGTVFSWFGERFLSSREHVAIEEAACNGHLAVIKWLHKNRGDRCTQRAMDLAAASGHLTIIEWMHQSFPRSNLMTSSTLIAAQTFRDKRPTVYDWIKDQCDKTTRGNFLHFCCSLRMLKLLAVVVLLVPQCLSSWRYYMNSFSSLSSDQFNGCFSLEMEQKDQIEVPRE